MGVWASWSLLRFLPEAQLVVHSDGTLDNESWKLWKRVIPRGVLVTKDEADAAIALKVAPKWPLLASWRGLHRTSPQVTDVHLFGQTGHLIIMDSDVLCFSVPDVVKRVVDSSQKKCYWHRDMRTCYVASRRSLRNATRLEFPPALNCGFCLLTRFAEEDYGHLELVLANIDRSDTIRMDRYWASQTLYAAWAASIADAHAFPHSYDVKRGRTSSNQTIRQYVGIPSIRPRYFLEGVPRILQGASTT